MVVGRRGFGGIGSPGRGAGAVDGAGVPGGMGVAAPSVELSHRGGSGGWRLLASLVNVVGDYVAAQDESDRDAALSGGGACGDAAAVERAVEGVVACARDRLESWMKTLRPNLRGVEFVFRAVLPLVLHARGCEGTRTALAERL